VSAGEPLAAAVRGVLNDAVRLYRDDRRAAGRLHRALGRLDEPLRIAVAGPWQSGKSTLVNAIMGEEVAPVEVGDGRQAVTAYADGPVPEVTAYSADGSARELAVTRSVNGMRVEPSGWQPGHVDSVVVRWPTRTLRHVTLVDTPAAGPGDDGRPDAAGRALHDADALLYLTRDLSGSDLRFLRSAQDGSVARAAPVNVVLVLSRTDETGGGRVDALGAARQLARRTQREPEVGSLGLGTVALSGLVAMAGRTLAESEFAALAALAAMPRAELDGLLLSTDRFTGTGPAAPLGAEDRRALLARLGIFGVRLATTLIRTGCDTRATLAAELVRRSGLAELREAMGRYFIDRRGALKARSALVAVESVLRAGPRPGAGDLLARLEYILATTHDFQEIRVLATLQDPATGLAPDLTAEARRLVGGNGTALAARLGIDPDAGVTELWGLGSQALYRWQCQAEDPLLTLAQRRVATAVVRSCEGMLARLSRGCA
jgi:hypothetical protein